MRRARFWLFISYIVSFASIVAAVWVMLEHYSADETLSGSEKWPGPAGIFQVGVGCCTTHAARFALLATHSQAHVLIFMGSLGELASGSRHVCMHVPVMHGLKTDWSMWPPVHDANTPAISLHALQLLQAGGVHIGQRAAVLHLTHAHRRGRLRWVQQLLKHAWASSYHEFQTFASKKICTSIYQCERDVE